MDKTTTVEPKRSSLEHLEDDWEAQKRKLNGIRSSLATIVRDDLGITAKQEERPNMALAWDNSIGELNADMSNFFDDFNYDLKFYIEQIETAIKNNSVIKNAPKDN